MVNRRQQHPANLDDTALMVECRVSPTRRSGPGGQRRNKVQTAVSITHLPTGIRAEASQRRSQAQNHRIAVFGLRLKLAVQVRTPCAAGSSPSALWLSRCRGGKIAVNTSHDDYPALLAEALDALSGHGWNPKPAAAALGCTTTQLVRFLASHQPALGQVNRHRADLDKHALH